MFSVKKIIILCCLFVCLQFAAGQNDDQGKENPQYTRKTSGPEDKSTAGYLKELMVDLAVANSGSYLTDRVITLNAISTESNAADQPVTGNLWVDDCKVSRVGPDQVKVIIKGKGWQWIQKSKKAAGAEFKLEQVVCFRINFETTVTFNLIYDHNHNIVTIYLKTIEPAQANLVVTGDIDIENEDLWSAIVGQAADIVGGSSEERAEEKIKQTAERKIISKMESGFTLIVDLCTSQYYTRFAKFPAGQLPLKEKSKDQKVQVNNSMKLSPEGLLMVGPFKPEKGVIARFQNADGAFKAYWICQNQAKDVANIFVRVQQALMRETDSVLTVAPYESTIFLPPKDTECPLYLVMVPLQRKIVTYDTKIWYRDDPPKALVKCGK